MADHIRRKIDELARGSRIRGIQGDEVVVLTYVRLCGADIVYCRFLDADGHEHDSFLKADAVEDTEIVAGPGVRTWIYPTGVPHLFRSIDDLVPLLLRTRSSGLLHPVAQAYLSEVASRLSNQMATVKEIYAVSGARNDALSTEPTREILWEIFGTRDRVEADLRKLERDTLPNRLKVAIILDEEVDRPLFETFTRARQGTNTTWLRVGDLLLADRFQNTLRTLDRALDRLSVGQWEDQLALVSFGLAPDLRHWKQLEDVVLSYWGLADNTPMPTLEDPVFQIDVQNLGTRQARIDEVYVNVRYRQEKLHGVSGDQTLRPAATVSVPLDGGQEGYRSRKIDNPVLVDPGTHARIEVRLEDAGYCWAGEIELGLRYGDRKVLSLPALGIIL